jgi:hypothetical protein
VGGTFSRSNISTAKEFPEMPPFNNLNPNISRVESAINYLETPGPPKEQRWRSEVYAKQRERSMMIAFVM